MDITKVKAGDISRIALEEVELSTLLNHTTIKVNDEESDAIRNDVVAKLFIEWLRDNYFSADTIARLDNHSKHLKEVLNDCEQLSESIDEMIGKLTCK